MNSQWLTLRDLEYVIAVAKHEHFGRAADECHVSQPSLSTQIKKIEGYLGVSLFERNNRRVRTTEAGRKLAAQAAVVLDEAAKIPSIMGQVSKARFEALRLGVIYSLAPFVPYVLPNLKKAFPEARLSLLEGTTAELVEELKAGALDAIIAADTVDDPSLLPLRLFFEPFVLAAPKGHPILEHSKLQASALKASDMVLLEEGHCLREQALDTCPSNRRGNPRSFHANSIENLRHLVASGSGYTLLPLLAATGKPMGNLITYRNFGSGKIGRTIVMLCREPTANVPYFQLLAKTLAASAPQQLLESAN